MVLGPGWSRTDAAQFAVPLAVLAIPPLTFTWTSVIPDESGGGSNADPAMEITLSLTVTPLAGLLMKTPGALLSSWPPGATRNRIEPREFVSLLATAMR